MLMYEALHFHNNKLSPSNSRRTRSRSNNSCGNNDSNNNNNKKSSSSSSRSKSGNRSDSSISSGASAIKSGFDGDKRELTKTRSFNNLQDKMYGYGPYSSSGNNNNNNASYNNNLNRSGSFVVGQKLRESKWFGHDEAKILCAVVETGFIVELKEVDGSDVDDECRSFGVVLWDQGFEKSKDPDHVSICTLQKYSKNNNYKASIVPLMEFWRRDTKIRINNQNDRKNVPHGEDVVRDQVAYAQANKSKWHNTEHFAFWCRYGPPHINYRAKLNSISEGSTKWNSFGLNGFLQLKNRFRRMTTK